VISEEDSACLQGYWSCLHLPSLSRKLSRSKQILDICLLNLLFDPEDGGRTFLRSIGKITPDLTAPHLFRIRKPKSCGQERAHFLQPLTVDWLPHCVTTRRDTRMYFVAEVTQTDENRSPGSASFPEERITLLPLHAFLNVRHMVYYQVHCTLVTLFYKLRSQTRSRLK
jgi:hypothetical protein